MLREVPPEMGSRKMYWKFQVEPGVKPYSGLVIESV